MYTPVALELTGRGCKEETRREDELPSRGGRGEGGREQGELMFFGSFCCVFLLRLVSFSPV